MAQAPLVRATVSHQRSLRPTDESRVVDYLTFGQATATTTQNGGGWRDRMGAIASIKVCDFDALAATWTLAHMGSARHQGSGWWAEEDLLLCSVSVCQPVVIAAAP